MKTDIELRNFWKDTAEAHRAINANKSAANTGYDVVIIGSGITAITTALVMQEEGKKCIVISSINPLLGNITTGNLTTIPSNYSLYTNDMSSKTIQLVTQSKREAIDLVEGLVNKYNMDCDFLYQTGFLFAQTGEQATLLEQTEAGARKAGVVSTETPQIPLPIPFNKAYRFDFQARLHPLKYVTALAAALLAAGGHIVTDSTVTAVTYTGNGITVYTGETAWQTCDLVYADDDAMPKEKAGSISACCYNAAFTLKEGTYPEAICYDMFFPGHSFSSYDIDGQKYIVATGFDNMEADHINLAFHNLENYLGKYFSIGRITHKWISSYHTGENGLPSIGLIPGHHHTYMISGLGNNAIVNGSIAAKIVCSHIFNRRTGYEELYRPQQAA